MQQQYRKSSFTVGGEDGRAKKKESTCCGAEDAETAIAAGLAASSVAYAGVLKPRVGGKWTL